jgi:hypothetical protein
MILPNTLLEQVEYYEIRTKSIMDGGFKTVITLHFKSFWRLRKKLVFKWKFVSYDSNEQQSNYRENDDCHEVRNQLASYFRNKNK